VRPDEGNFESKLRGISENDRQALNLTQALTLTPDPNPSPSSSPSPRPRPRQPSARSLAPTLVLALPP